MLSNGQVWKNGCKIAQINIEDDISKAVIFNINKDKLQFSKVMEIKDEWVLFEMGFNPTSHILVAKEV